MDPPLGLGVPLLLVKPPVGLSTPAIFKCAAVPALKISSVPLLLYKSHDGKAHPRRKAGCSNCERMDAV